MERLESLDRVIRERSERGVLLVADTHRPLPTGDQVSQLMARADYLLNRCQETEAGLDDEGGPRVTWERLVRCQELLKSIIDEQFSGPLTGSGIPGILRDRREWDEARRNECGLWALPDTATVREILAKVESMAQAVHTSLSRMRWEQWLDTFKDKSQKLILRDVWPLLETAQGPLTREQIAAKSPDQLDWTLLGRALSAACKDGYLKNRRKNPKGYFLPERFPHLIDPSK
jgi:hypothetical protein